MAIVSSAEAAKFASHIKSQVAGAAVTVTKDGRGDSAKINVTCGAGSFVVDLEGGISYMKSNEFVRGYIPTTRKKLLDMLKAGKATKKVAAKKTEITSIDRPTVQMLRTEFEALVESFAAKHGLKVKPHGACFDNTEVKMSTTLFIENAETGGSQREASDWKRYARGFGIENLDALGKTFRYGTDTVLVVGLMPRRRKFPVVVKRLSDDRVRLFSVGLANQVFATKQQKPDASSVKPFAKGAAVRVKYEGVVYDAKVKFDAGGHKLDVVFKGDAASDFYTVSRNDVKAK